MKTYRLMALGGTVVAAAMMTAGCSSVQKGAAAGGAIGGVAGAVTGHNVASLGTGTGAFLGAGAGAATGGLAGDAFDQVTQDDMEREMQNLRAELEAKEAELAALRDAGMSEDALAELESLRDEVASARSRIATLEGDLSGANDELASLRGADSQIAKLRTDLETTRSDLQSAETALADRNTELQQQDKTLRDAITERDEALSAAERYKRDLELAEAELSDARQEMDVIQASLREKASAVDKLRSELEDLNLELEQTSRGLSVTIVDELLFEPGEAMLTTEGAGLIGQVADLIGTNFPDRELLVEGHTDNQPIVHSNWYSNWELGAARALTVTHELVDIHGFSPELISATSYGEHRPAASNATAEGRAQNRRSVIVILPETTTLTRKQFAGL